MKKIGDNFSFAELGPFEKIDQYIFKHPKLTEGVAGKKFLKEELGLTSMEVSLNKFPAGTSMPFGHKHRANEELYLFLKGKGEFCVDGEWFEVQEGSAIKVAPNGVRTWRSSASEELLFIVIQAKAWTLGEDSIQDGILVKP